MFRTRLFQPVLLIRGNNEPAIATPVNPAARLSLASRRRAPTFGEMNALAVRNVLRSDRADASLARRRRIALLSAVGLLDFVAISLYQLGIIRRLPDLPGRLFDTNAVNASPRAYPLGVPDGPLGAALFAVTMVLAGAGGTRATGRSPLVSLLLGAAGFAGAAGAAKYLWDMITKEKKACPYCLVGAGLDFGIATYAWPEVRQALTELRRS